MLFYNIFFPIALLCVVRLVGHQFSVVRIRAKNFAYSFRYTSAYFIHFCRFCLPDYLRTASSSPRGTFPPRQTELPVRDSYSKNKLPQTYYTQPPPRSASHPASYWLPQSAHKRRKIIPFRKVYSTFLSFGESGARNRANSRILSAVKEKYLNMDAKASLRFLDPRSERWILIFRNAFAFMLRRIFRTSLEDFSFNCFRFRRFQIHTNVLLKLRA